MKKNTASQIVGCQMVSATDGTAFTGSVTVSVTGDGGTQATGSVGSGVCTHEGNGFHTYAPAQAETNYDHVAFTFTGTGAVPATVQVYTSFPQTGDAFGRLGAPAGASVSADVAAVKAETAAIVADTSELQTDWANGGRLDLILDARASQASVDTIDGIVDAILIDTAEIGVAGAGLTAVPWNAAWDAEVQSEVADGLAAFWTSPAALVDLVWDEAIAGHAGAGSTGEALAGATAPSAAAVADAVWDEAIAGHAVSGSTGEALSAAGAAGDPWITALPGSYSAGQAGKIVGDALDAAISSRMASYTQPTGFLAATFPGTVASPTNITAGTITTVTNLTNLPAAAALEATLTAMKGATFSGATDSLEALRDRGDAAWATATGFATPTNITAASGVTLAATTGLGNQTANITGNLSGSVGSVTGAVGSVTGAVGSVTGLTAADVSAIKAKTDSLTFTTAGQVDANVLAISSSTDAANNLEESTEVIGTGTCTTGGSTTSVVASAVSPASAVNDQFNGRVMIFKGNVTAALAGQATTISDYVHATLTFTVVALTTSPASGDLFTIL